MHIIRDSHYNDPFQKEVKNDFERNTCDKSVSTPESSNKYHQGTFFVEVSSLLVNIMSTQNIRLGIAGQDGSNNTFDTFLLRYHHC